MYFELYDFGKRKKLIITFACTNDLQLSTVSVTFKGRRWLIAKIFLNKQETYLDKVQMSL